MNPVLLHHGIFGYDRIQLGPLQWSYFGGGIEEEIASRGHRVVLARVSKTACIADRASQLKEIIQDRFPTTKERLIILAHSMGGLDARYMITKLQMSHRIAALVTLSTPHRGSSYADYMLRHIDRSPPVRQVLELFQLDLAGVRDLTIASMARFNEIVPDHPDTAYFSISASRPWHRVPAYLLHSHRVVTRNEGDNDGIVSVKSAQWGEHLETWPADHMHVVNRIQVLEIRQRTGNVRGRYAKLLEALAQRGIIGANRSSPVQ